MEKKIVHLGSVISNKKSGLDETLNFSMCADSSTNTNKFFTALY